MELSWLMKLRITAAAVIGVVLIGIVSWPSQSPPDPYGSLLLKEIGTNTAVTLLVMAFLAGFISYYAAWPYGREIGILAVPFGLTIWAVRAGTLGGLFQQNPGIIQRQEILSNVKWEPIFWLLVFAVGFAGVLLAQRIGENFKKSKSRKKQEYSPGKFASSIVSVFISGVIVVFCLRVFAKGVGVVNTDKELIAVQPIMGQIIFAVLMSFGIAAFVVKTFLKTNYLWPMFACIIVTIYSVNGYMQPSVLESFMNNWPAIFFPDETVTILPVQIVTFGVIGSVIGYWMAVRYHYWRKHEM